ncbi:MAG: ROK family protein [Actinomycetia bacterium]|nr:ROK family protein [Actinomycetes bacterium]
MVGVDIGGTGCKAALVDLLNGELASERQRIDTPHPATPDAVAQTVVRLLDVLGGADVIGLTVPAVVRGGVVRSAANIDPEWIGTDAVSLFSEALSTSCTVLNDADAAGIAEMRFGAGSGRNGVVVVVTLGTGIGTAVFTDGVLVPNTELGHIELKGMDAEQYAASSVRDREDLSWKRWGHRVGRYMALLEKLLSPELIIVGGGVSKKFDRYSDHMLEKTSGETEIVPAQSLNQAGIVGAAIAASRIPSTATS